MTRKYMLKWFDNSEKVQEIRFVTAYDRNKFIEQKKKDGCLIGGDCSIMFGNKWVFEYHIGEYL